MNPNCTNCPLYKYRRKIVHGRGFLPADVVIIGEAPGQTEDMMGMAFIGDAGQLLDRMIADADPGGIRIYFTNTVLCRPTDKIGGPNREPTNEEIFSCSMNVREILDRTQAKRFILAGDIAEKYMKNVVVHYTKITHPSAILRLGGVNSAYYQQTVQILKQVFREVHNEIS